MYFLFLLNLLNYFHENIMKYYIIYIYLKYMLYKDDMIRLTRNKFKLKQHTLIAIKNKNDPSKLDIKNSAYLKKYYYYISKTKSIL